jgi:hypothetical protein
LKVKATHALPISFGRQPARYRLEPRLGARIP